MAADLANPPADALERRDPRQPGGRGEGRNRAKDSIASRSRLTAFQKDSPYLSDNDPLARSSGSPLMRPASTTPAHEASPLVRALPSLADSR
jgi:hypothetical protein